MKCLLLALSVILLIGNSEALKCYLCEGDPNCDAEKVCDASEDKCFADITPMDDGAVFYEQGCADTATCDLVVSDDNPLTACCQEDLCNKFIISDSS
ncbi:lymphocyte antigen 6D-like [Stigmatopora nigra]